MKYNNKEQIREEAIKLYIEGKKLQEIANITNCSRNYIGNLIREDDRIKQYKNKKNVKVYKYKNRTKMYVPISVNFFEQIGISKDFNTDDFVTVEVDKKNKIIYIKKA